MYIFQIEIVQFIDTEFIQDTVFQKFNILISCPIIIKSLQREDCIPFFPEPEGNLLIRLIGIGMQHPFLHQIELRVFMICPEQMEAFRIGYFGSITQ